MVGVLGTPIRAVPQRTLNAGLPLTGTHGPVDPRGAQQVFVGVAADNQRFTASRDAVESYVLVVVVV